MNAYFSTLFGLMCGVVKRLYSISGCCSNFWVCNIYNVDIIISWTLLFCYTVIDCVYSYACWWVREQTWKERDWELVHLLRAPLYVVIHSCSEWTIDPCPKQWEKQTLLLMLHHCVWQATHSKMLCGKMKWDLVLSFLH